MGQSIERPRHGEGAVNRYALSAVVILSGVIVIELIIIAHFVAKFW
jgi:hypothetical protein